MLVRGGDGKRRRRSCIWQLNVRQNSSLYKAGIAESYWILSSSSASSSSVEMSSSSSFSFYIEDSSAGSLNTWYGGGFHTPLSSNTSFRASSRWCSRLNLLILSWSSRRTSTSSAASSSLESYKDLSAARLLLGGICNFTMRRCIIEAMVAVMSTPISALVVRP